MKEFKLASWPELAAPYRRIAYRRLLSDLSQRHLTQAQLAECSGLSRAEVQQFLELLGQQGVLNERERLVPEATGPSFSPLRDWLRRFMRGNDDRA